MSSVPNQPRVADSAADLYSQRCSVLCIEDLQTAIEKTKCHGPNAQGVAVNESHSHGRAKVTVTEREGARQEKLKLLTVSQGLTCPFLLHRRCFAEAAAERKR